MRRNILFFIMMLLAALPALGCEPRPDVPAQPLDWFTAEATPLIAERRFSEALEILETAAQTLPDEPAPLVQMGQIYLAQHRWLLAEDAFNRALARDLQQPAAMTGLAEAIMGQGRLAEALELWQTAAQTHPQQQGVFTGLGRTHLFRLEFETARAAFVNQQEQTFDPEAAWYLAALSAPTDPAAAREQLQSLSPDQPDEPLRARRDYLLAALEAGGDDAVPASAAKAVGIAFVQAEYWPLAIYALQTAHQTAAAPDAEALSFLAHALAQAGRPALDLFEQAKHVDAASALPLYFEAIYLRQQEAFQAAEELLVRAIELDPDNGAIYAEYARTRILQGDLATAEAAYQAAVEVTDGDNRFKLLLAGFCAEHSYRMIETGIPAAVEIIEADETNAQAHSLLGWMQFLTGDLAAAETSLGQALALAPDLISARFHLARLYEARNQKEMARAEYQRVVDWDASDHFRPAALKGLQRLTE